MLSHFGGRWEEGSARGHVAANMGASRNGQTSGMLGLKSAGEKVVRLTYLDLRAAAPTLGNGGTVCRPAEGGRRGGGKR